ncbi:MAG: hypothetical protein A3B91_04190 [Candidatus Yanofskybacteria bacterium RIFCSPHIGHO2_02_FULL_41_29]|uniref:Uncharacterized protein n=1 Tax=Candidatus Yanofskybacteria bacterium RIFCSPHIGHO2_01_FULL_41_53 TaxID=1802663 RepID=A0A1F8EK59_9BACT|nr:MAG: hypothetical protein A2650_03450 [Candidatus Yanofskybacteria bacterium RIFCSPHIGHO2_01_FULL_41_53]OGN11723.1 MAG: hypothetical protein A3B91_04190 [Candidatus Yanofskybacteria bacterium RIFCSPHIGHO2_02_FULL_41_29]OGN17488.1 MAG: hypothetical protein A3F48_01750 [Candidatus Yanofskybacteria bacterium RIFCSPHIGHO2_12_FULL_41_9]OGN22877.1 MAG: hypothetical protein A2916_00645 [Candidatus Yanofskybacteria bacterium RIFCSPLOWO2_01_FULL_41_67]OGN28717.1 MAG: hypothetical protein A3H54_02355 
MKYLVNNYVDAFTEVIKKTPKKSVVENFIKLLKKTGDIKRLNKIVEAIDKKLVNKNGGKWVVVETARESASADKIRNKFSNKDHVEFKVNPELVAGTRVTINGEEELNNTLSSKLNKMFK